MKFKELLLKRGMSGGTSVLNAGDTNIRHTFCSQGTHRLMGKTDPETTHVLAAEEAAPLREGSEAEACGMNMPRREERPPRGGDIWIKGKFMHEGRSVFLAGRTQAQRWWHSVHPSSPECLSKAGAQGKWWGMRVSRKQGSDSRGLWGPRLVNLDFIL